MMKTVEIITPYLADYRNGEVLQVSKSIIDLFDTHSPVDLHVDTVFNTLLLSYNAAFAAYKKGGLTEITQEVHNEDHNRDWAYKTFNNLSKAFAKHYDTTKAEAGQRLQRCLDKYGEKVEDRGYVEETSLLHSIYRDLTTDPKLVLDVETCALKQVVEDINSRNIDFEKIYAKRNKIVSEYDPIRFAEKLKTLCTDCKNLFKKIEACAIVFEEIDYQPLVNQINTIIQQLNETIVLRKSRSSKKGKEQNPENLEDIDNEE